MVDARLPKPTNIVSGDFSWPGMALYAVFLSMVLSLTCGSPDVLNRILGRAEEPPKVQAPVPLQKALVVTAKADHQLTIAATLEPRGFQPLIARNVAEAMAQLQAHPGDFHVAVLDAALPGYAQIAQTLQATLPPRDIIILSDSLRPEALGPMLLNRL